MTTRSWAMPYEGRGAATLDTIGHGTLLAERYRLGQRVRSDRDGTTWRGVDESTETPVSVLVLRPDLEHADEVVDAALRVTDLSDPRLVRVIGAGKEPVAYVVTERIVGRDLPKLLADGPLSAPLARRIVGETAAALAVASRSGLHHLRLGPRSVVVTPEGDVRVNGVAVNAAAVGVEQPDADLAERADAVGLVRLLYASLTCRWPDRKAAGLAAAPRIAGRPVAPGDLVAGVPSDLDALCVQTLARGEGPQSPTEVVERLGDWQDAGADDDLLAMDAAVAPLHRPRGDRDSDVLKPPAAAAVPPGTRTGPDVTEPDLTEPDVTEPDLTEPDVTASEEGTASDEGTEPDGAGSEGGARTGELPAVPAPRSEDSAPPIVPTTDDRTPSEVEEWEAAVTDLIPAGSPVEVTAPDAPETPIFGIRAPRVVATSLTEVLPPREPLGELMPAQPSLPRDQTRVLLGAILAMMLIGFVFAFQSVAEVTRNSASFFEDDQTAVVIPAPQPTEAPSESEQGSSGAAGGGSPSPTPTSTTTKAVKPDVVGIQAIDPLGDGDENGSRAPMAIDGKKSTTWRSARYATAEFGGLKDGLGLVIELKKAAPVSSVTVDVGGDGGTVELRTASDPAFEGSTKVAAADIENGKATLTVKDPEKSRYVIVWFTKVPRYNGEYRLDVSEIVVT